MAMGDVGNSVKDPILRSRVRPEGEFRSRVFAKGIERKKSA